MKRTVRNTRTATGVYETEAQLNVGVKRVSNQEGDDNAVAVLPQNNKSVDGSTSKANKYISGLYFPLH